MRRLLGVLLLLVFALVAWRVLTFVTGLLLSLIGVAVLACLAYLVYRLALAGLRR